MLGIGTQCLVVGLIAGIFALRLKYVVLAALGASALSFCVLACVRPLHKISIVVLLNFGYWIVSGAASGGLGWPSLCSGDFWRGEGRCFFFYLPLLAIPMLRIRQVDLRLIVKTITVLTVLGAILWGLWLLGFGHLFQAEEDAETGELIPSIYFIGLLTSHTGAGAFWATVASFLLGYSLRRQDGRLQLLAMVAALMTLATGGRAATLGLAAVVVRAIGTGDLLRRRLLKVVLPAAIPAVAGLWFLVACVPEVSERMAEVFSPRTVSALFAWLDEPVLHHAAGFFYSGSDLEHHNLVIRVFLWRYALHLFFLSPITGIGFCRFNDPYLQYAGVPHVANLAVDGEPYFGSGIRWEQQQLMTSTGNAHNSYLHMLAETGIIGLALFLYLWYLLYKYCHPDGRPDRPRNAFEDAFCHGCRAMIISLLVTAVAGHALAAPSGGVLLTTVVGAWVAYRGSGEVAVAGQRRKQGSLRTWGAFRGNA